MSHWTNFFDDLEEQIYGVIETEKTYPLSFYYDNPRFKEWPEIILIKRSCCVKIPNTYEINQHRVTLPRSLMNICLSLGILTNGEDVYVITLEPIGKEQCVHIGLKDLMSVKMLIEVCTKIYTYFFNIAFVKFHETYIFYPFVSEFFVESDRRMIRQSTHIPHMILSMGSINHCPLCLINFNSECNVPLVLKCNCTICKPCLQIISMSDKESFITCPACNDKETPKVDLSELIVNHLFYF